MSDNTTREVTYIDDSVGQRRLLRSTLMDRLAKIFIAALAGCVFVGTASSGGTKPLLIVLSIVVGLLLISVTVVLLLFFRKRGKIIAAVKKHEQG